MKPRASPSCSSGVKPVAPQDDGWMERAHGLPSDLAMCLLELPEFASVLIRSSVFGEVGRNEGQR